MDKIPLQWDGKQIGVYCIRNRGNGKVYIGSSKNCYHRVRGQHFAKLQNGTHSNPHLQSAWKKYGKSRFECFCVELCSRQKLHKREEYWMGKMHSLDRQQGYNINPHADRIEMTQERKDKISLSLLGRSQRRGFGSGSGITRVNNKYGPSWRVELWCKKSRYFLGTFKNRKTADSVRLNTLNRLREGQGPDWAWVKTKRSCRWFCPILQLDENFLFIKRYDSADEFRVCGWSLSGIWHACNGRAKTYKGFHWRYVGVHWEYKRGRNAN